MQILGTHPHMNVSQEVGWGPGICIAAAHLGTYPQIQLGITRPGLEGFALFLACLQGLFLLRAMFFFFHVYSAEPRVLALRIPQVPVMGPVPFWPWM